MYVTLTELGQHIVRQYDLQNRLPVRKADGVYKAEYIKVNIDGERVFKIHGLNSVFESFFVLPEKYITPVS